MTDDKDPRKKRFYHGGDGGLKVGDYILPSKDNTGRNNMIGLNPLWREDRVYLTKNVADAWCFAARSNNPRVYEVTPLGELEDDPDLPTKGISFQCPKANIIALYEEPPGIVEHCRELMRKTAARKR
ncbi:MAG: NAD(+)--rifampin ADP-ribosyltransferase [Bradyrhizobium sp.]